MVLPCVDLPQDAAYPRPTGPHQDEQVFSDEHVRLQMINKLNVGQSLLVGAHLVLALHNQNPLRFEDPPRFPATCEVEVQDRFMVLMLPVGRGVILVVVLVVLVVDVGGAPGVCM